MVVTLFSIVNSDLRKQTSQLYTLVTRKKDGVRKKMIKLGWTATDLKGCFEKTDKEENNLTAFAQKFRNPIEQLK